MRSSIENELVCVVWLCCLEQNKEVQGLCETLSQKKKEFKFNDKNLEFDCTVPLCSTYTAVCSLNDICESKYLKFIFKSPKMTYVKCKSPGPLVAA